MRKTTLDTIRELSLSDVKTLTAKGCKVGEECGEIQRAILAYDGQFGNTHRFADKALLLDNVADLILCARDIAYHADCTDEEIEDMVVAKCRKWSYIQSRHRKAGFPVPYEFHVTVRTSDIKGFRDTCELLGVKAVIIDLQDRQGGSLMQDVMTSSTYIGNNPGAYTELQRITSGLREAGFEVVREKIETVPWHPAAPDAPNIPEEEQEMPKGCYFETHFGVRLSHDQVPALREVAGMINAHMSRNVFKTYDDGTVKVMLTARSYTGSATRFQERVDHISGELCEMGYTIDKVIVEFALYDTSVHHDATWVQA